MLSPRFTPGRGNSKSPRLTRDRVNSRPFLLTPARGHSKSILGRPIDGERSSERSARGTPPNTLHTPTSVSLGRTHGKRPSDSTDDGTAFNKRRKVSAATQNSSPLKNDRVGGLNGLAQRTPVIDLTGDEDDAPQANSSDPKRHVKSTSSTSLASPPRQTRSTPRRSRYSFPRTPASGTKRKRDFIDLTGDGSDDGSTTSSSSPLGKTVQSQPLEDVFDSSNIKKPVAPGPLADYSRQRPEPKHGQARPVDSAEKKGATRLTTRSQARVYPSFATAFRPGQLSDGSPRASKDMTAPMKSASAQEDTEKILVNNGSMSVVHNGEAVPDLGVSAGTSQLKRSSVLTVRGQAKKGSELVCDGRAEGSHKHEERGSTGLSLDIVRKGDTRDQLQPPTPRSSRRRRRKVVVLRAPPEDLRRISRRPVQRPDVPMGVCFLLLVPLEIQKMIFANLLLADDPIQVLHGWAKLYQRQRSNLHPAILSTCREIYKNASAFLYGRNVFRYMVRDRPQSDAFPSFGQDIIVEKCIPLFRKLELKIERSRTEHAYCTSLANAIHLLNTHGANLHTLVLDVSPSVEGDTLSTVGYFYQNGEIIRALKALKTCFIVLRVFTPKTKDEPATGLRRKLDIRTELCHFENAPGQPPQTQLDDLSEMITRACESPAKVLKEGLFEESEVAPQQNERQARQSSITYNDDNDDDDVGGSDEDDDGDDSGDFVV